MKRKVSPYLVALPALAIILVFRIWPVIYSFILSFFEYNPKLGISGSRAVGLTNFLEFVKSYYFWRLLRNTFVLSLLPVFMTCLVSFAAAVCIVKLPNRWTRCLALSVLAIPAFVPAPVLCGVIKDLVSSGSFITGFMYNTGFINEKTNLLVVPSLYPFIYSAAETLRFMFFPTAAAVLVSNNNGAGQVVRILRVIGAYALIRFAFMFVMDEELTISLYNPMVYETADTINSFTHRKGLLEANYGFSSAVDAIRNVFQIVLNVFLFFGIKALLIGDDMSFETQERENFRPSAVIGVIGVILACAGSAAIIYSLVSGISASPSAFVDVITDERIIRGLYNSLVYSACSALILTLLSLFLAYPLSSRSKAYTLILFLLVFVTGTNGAWLISREAGLADSAGAVILAGGISVAGAFIIHLLTWQKTRGTDGFANYLKAAAPAAVLVLALSFILSWGSTGAMIYLQRREKFPISLLLREIMIQGQVYQPVAAEASAELIQAGKAAAAIVGSLPPLIIGWLLIWFGKRLFKKEISEESPAELVTGDARE